MSEERLARIEEKVDRLADGLSRLTDLVTRIVGDVGELKGRATDTPSAIEFGELRGRVEEISRRQGVTLAYTPPDQRRV